MEIIQTKNSHSSLDEIVNAVDVLEVAFALFDAEDRLLYCNKQFKSTHHAISDILDTGLLWPIFMREAKRTGTGNGLSRIDGHLVKGSEETLKFDATRPGDRWVRSRMQPMNDGSFIVTETDITEAHIASEIQAEAEGLLRRVLDASGARIMMVSLNDRKVIYRSPAHIEFLGEFDDVVDIFPNPYDRSDYLAEILPAGYLDNYELDLVNAEGKVFPASITGRLINYEGEEVIVNSVMDLTELYAQRDELARQREASFQNEKLTALGELLAGVAHELNNPLSVVVGQSLMLKEENLNDDLARRVDKISASAERCAKIVKTFLAMARQKPIKLESISLKDVMEVALDVAAYGLRATGAEIIINLADNLPNILADEDQIAQVFINLIVNAEHAVEDKGKDAKVTISIECNRETGMVVTKFSDNGPGVPKHLRTRVFEPFFTTKNIGKGTGVGLALCHRIITTHHGKLDVVDSRLGGAMFSVELPVTLETQAQDQNAYGRLDRKVSNITALVVDDEVDVAEMICDMLNIVGINSTFVCSAEKAIEILTTGQTFDLIFSDLKMPGLSGLEFLEILYERWPALTKRFTIITGDAMSNAVEDIRKNINVPLLEKPVAPHELRNIVQQLVGSMNQ